MWKNFSERESFGIIKEANREFQDILKDMQQNQILHMAMPDKELENMVKSVNQALEQIRTER